MTVTRVVAMEEVRSGGILKANSVVFPDRLAVQCESQSIRACLQALDMSTWKDGDAII